MVGPASIVFRHTISRSPGGEKLVEATVKLVYVQQSMKPLRLRQNVLDAVSEGSRVS